ncbi:MAG: hypothetical protein WC248_06525 [Candidatus Methanomethylophilaceae archaeon]
MIEVMDEVGGLFNRKEYLAVTTDVFDITNRIKEIDPNYFILWNRIKDRYEVHSKRYPSFTFCLVVPYSELDQRTLDLVWDTRAEKARELITKLNMENEHRDKKQEEYARDYIKWVGGEVFSYLNKFAAKDTVDKGAFKTRFI